MISLGSLVAIRQDNLEISQISQIAIFEMCKLSKRLREFRHPTHMLAFLKVSNFYK